MGTRAGKWEFEPATEVGHERAPRRRGGLGTRVGMTLLVVGLLGGVAGIGTWSAFSSTTDNVSNDFEAGTVVLTDNDSDGALLSLPNAKPGNYDEGCITVAFSGTLPSSVTMSGSGTTTSGTSLAAYLNLVITRGDLGVSPPAFDSCTGFSPDAVDYTGAGSGVVFSGTLAGFNALAAGLTDPTSGSPEVWSSSESHVYKIRVTVQNDNAAQGLDATQTFSWEARNN